jgi:hypothetical protein
MPPTIALKCRLDRAMKQEAAARLSLLSPSFRSVSIGSEMELATNLLKPRPLDDEAAELLLSMSNIVSKEIMNNALIFDDDDDSSKDSRSSARSTTENLLTPSLAHHQTSTNSLDDRFTWNRVRTVSIDSPLHLYQSDEIAVSLGNPAIVSPMNTPVGRGRPVRKASLRLSHKAKREHLKLPKMPQLITTISVNDHKKKALQASVAKGTPIKKILRKKFSWKNYPGKGFDSHLVMLASSDSSFSPFCLILSCLLQSWKPS